jgi:hypothetical protein
VIYAIIFLGVVCVGQLWVILATVKDGAKERSARAGEAYQERVGMTDRLMAVMTDEDNPLFASVNATGIRAVAEMDRPHMPAEVSYVDEEREYQLQRKNGNGDDEET